MNESVLVAQERTECVKLLRKSGFIPGVLYGEGLEKSLPVKFKESSFNNLIHHHGLNAKVWVEINGKRQYGMIKELQNDVLSGKFVHADIYLLSQTDEIRIKLPIIFTGESELEHKNIQLKIHKSKIDVSGKAGLLPEQIVMNVENLMAGDTVQVKDLMLNESIIIHDPVDEVFAIALDIKVIDEEVPTEVNEPVT